MGDVSHGNEANLPGGGCATDAVWNSTVVPGRDHAGKGA